MSDIKFTGSTKAGNIAYSTVSQEDANYRAELMDYNGCVNCIDCVGCVDCTNCEDCTECRHCNNCKHCTGAIGWDSGLPKVTRLYTINNLHWPVATDGIYIQIGCQRHTVKDWKNFDDVRIYEMDPKALVFWKKHKEQIIQLAEERRRSEEHYQHKESA